MRLTSLFPFSDGNSILLSNPTTTKHFVNLMMVAVTPFLVYVRLPMDIETEFLIFTVSFILNVVSSRCLFSRAFNFKFKRLISRVKTSISSVVIGIGTDFCRNSV